MKRIATQERPDWKATAETAGFIFHTMYDEPYWDETSAYEFSLDEIELDIEDPSTELHQMCREAVDHIVSSEQLMDRMSIPDNMKDLVKNSWWKGDQELYGRFDLVYNGDASAKMLEYNADTPTSLYEAAVFQWQWLEEMLKLGYIPPGSDQFNRIYDALTERFAELFGPGDNIHFTSVGGQANIEDFGTVETMAWAAKDAGLTSHYTAIEDIGLTANGQFVDDNSRVIGSVFKLYPWEDLLRDSYATSIAGSNCRFIEPAWKALVSNKGILPVLWNMFPGHKNLLPAYWANESHSLNNYVTKPIFSREGASVRIFENGKLTETSVNQEYDQNRMIVQEYCPLPVFDGYRPIIGSWVVGQTCVGIGIREDQSRITQDLSRFKPHYIKN